MTASATTTGYVFVNVLIAVAALAGVVQAQPPTVTAVSGVVYAGVRGNGVDEIPRVMRSLFFALHPEMKGTFVANGTVESGSPPADFKITTSLGTCASLDCICSVFGLKSWELENYFDDTCRSLILCTDGKAEKINSCNEKAIHIPTTSICERFEVNDAKCTPIRVSM